MKKIFLVFVLAAVIATGAVFADHPDGWGIGFVGGGAGDFGSGAGASYGLSLKAPSMPIYWGINPRFESGFTYLGVTGDYYVIDSVLVSDIGLHWYLGVGGFATLGFGNSNVHISLGARVPIGLSWQLGIGGPINAIEVFLQLAPSLGVSVSPKVGFIGGWDGGLGFRVWF